MVQMSYLMNKSILPNWNMLVYKSPLYGSAVVQLATGCDIMFYWICSILAHRSSGSVEDCLFHKHVKCHRGGMKLL